MQQCFQWTGMQRNGCSSACTLKEIGPPSLGFPRSASWPEHLQGCSSGLTIVKEHPSKRLLLTHRPTPSRLLKKGRSVRRGLIHSCRRDLAEVMMRGTDKRSGELFSYVDLEARVRADLPLRAIRKVVARRWRRCSASSPYFIAGWVGPRSRRRSCCGRCCCRPSTRSARSASSWSGSSSTCCSAGSSGSAR